jgi:hypothetical protein
MLEIGEKGMQAGNRRVMEGTVQGSWLIEDKLWVLPQEGAVVGR